MLNLCTHKRRVRFEDYEKLAVAKKEALREAKAARTSMCISPRVDDEFSWQCPNFDGDLYYEMSEWDARRLGIW